MNEKRTKDSESWNRGQGLIAMENVPAARSNSPKYK